MIISPQEDYLRKKESQLKLWLLDADVIIDLLSMRLFDSLVERHDVYVATSVINEVKSHFRSYWDDRRKVLINFREQYVDNGKVKELSANSTEVDEYVISKM